MATRETRPWFALRAWVPDDEVIIVETGTSPPLPRTAHVFNPRKRLVYQSSFANAASPVTAGVGNLTKGRTAMVRGRTRDSRLGFRIEDGGAVVKATPKT